MYAVALAAGEVTDLLVLIRSAEVERGDVGAAVAHATADVDLVLTIGDLFEDRLRRHEGVARLRDVGELHGVAQPQRAGVRRLLVGHKSEEGGLPRSVRSDHTDDAAARELEREVVEQQPFAVALADG